METGKLKMVLCLAGLFLLGYVIGVEIGSYMARMEFALNEYRNLKFEIESHFIGDKNGKDSAAQEKP